MQILDIRAINGPNVFHAKPVLVMTLALGKWVDTPSCDIAGFNEKLIKLLPGLTEHHCSPGHRGGFIERLERGTYFAHITEHIALEMSIQAGIEVGFGKSIFDSEPDVYKVIVRFRNEEAMKFLLRTAVEVAQCLMNGSEYSASELQVKIAQAKQIVSDTELGPSTRAIVEAAEKRGIPWCRLNDLNMIQFGHGKNRRLIQATTTSLTGDIAVDIAQDKDLTKKLLAAANIRVPRGIVARDESEVLRAFEDLEGPVALKPVDGHHGQGVALNLNTPAEVGAAYLLAARYSETVIVEEYLEGKDYRVLVVGGKMVAAAERRPAHVVGDGIQSIRELVERENANPLRGEGHEKPMTKIFLDASSLNYLVKSGRNLETVPEQGEVVYLKETANLSTGGTAIDCTDEVHPEIRAMCERAARIVGLDICGVDVIAKNISSPPHRDFGIVEVNAGPGIRMHIYPSVGKARDVGSAIVDLLYPHGSSGRIPIVSITGTNGKTTVTRLTSFIMEKARWSVGMTTTDGIFIAGQKVASGDTTGPISARAVLGDPDVEIAVLETARGGICRRGLGYDWSDVGVITNIRADHIGQDGIRSVEDILHIKSLVAERVRSGGTLVLNADDEMLTMYAGKLRSNRDGRKLIYYSTQGANPVVLTHIEAGGTAYYLDRGWIVEFREGYTKRLIHTSEIPLTLNGTAEFQVSNVMAAIATCVDREVPYEIIFAGLRAFRPNEHNAGRSNLYKVGRAHVMLDYGHNPDAFRAVSEMVSKWRTRRLIGVIGVPGDRSNEVICDSARVAARGFDYLIVRDDLDLRGRKSGEAPQVFLDAVAQEKTNTSCTLILNEFEAMRFAIRNAIEGDLIVIFYDELQPAAALLKDLGAEPVSGTDLINFYAQERLHHSTRSARMMDHGQAYATR